MNTLMQREDFLALCPGPANGGVYISDRIPYGVRPIPTHRGMSRANQMRVMGDWFPAGEIFQFLGTTCFSRGPEQVGFGSSRGAGSHHPRLRVTAPSPKGGMEDVFFSVKEALNIARQISVDRVNFLNNALPNK